MPDDDRCDRNPRRRQSEHLLSFESIEKTLRETNPARAQSCSAGRKHQVLGRKRAILDDPRTGRSGRYQDQRGCMVENLKVRIPEFRAKMIRLSPLSGAMASMWLLAASDIRSSKS